MRRHLPPKFSEPQKLLPLTVRLLLVIDASTSMQPYRDRVISSFQDFFRRLPQIGVQYIISVVEFSWRPTVRIQQVKLENLPPLSTNPRETPRSMTRSQRLSASRRPKKIRYFA